MEPKASLLWELAARGPPIPPKDVTGPCPAGLWSSRGINVPGTAQLARLISSFAGPWDRGRQHHRKDGGCPGWCCWRGWGGAVWCSLCISGWIWLVMNYRLIISWKSSPAPSPATQSQHRTLGPVGEGDVSADLSAKPEEEDESNGVFSSSTSGALSTSVVTPEENTHCGASVAGKRGVKPTWQTFSFFYWCLTLAPWAHGCP